MKSKVPYFNFESPLFCNQKSCLNISKVLTLLLVASHTFYDAIGIYNTQLTGFTQIGNTPAGISQ